MYVAPCLYHTTLISGGSMPLQIDVSASMGAPSKNGKQTLLDEVGWPPGSSQSRSRVSLRHGTESGCRLTQWPAAQALEGVQLLIEAKILQTKQNEIGVVRSRPSAHLARLRCVP